MDADVRPVAIVCVTDTVTVWVTVRVVDGDHVPGRDGCTVGKLVELGVMHSEAVTVLVTDVVTDVEAHDDAEAHEEAPGDFEPLEHKLTLEDTDGDGQAEGVDPAGAQNGPMLNVARCVPSRDASGDADWMDGEPVGDARPVAERTDGEPVGDARPVAIVCVTDGESDCDGQCDTDTVKDTVRVDEL